MSTRSTVSSLYRRSLKLSLDWCVQRHLWRGQALYIRSLFEAQKNVHDPRLQRASSPIDTKEEALFRETEDLLEKWKHPDPYRPPTAPGGSKYERNLPSPILDRKLYNTSTAEIAALTFHSSSKDGSVSTWGFHGKQGRWLQCGVTISGRNDELYIAQGIRQCLQTRPLDLSENLTASFLSDFCGGLYDWKKNEHKSK
ncbi:hypothetical protein BGAL_0232g00020 [Botrytis galanthina]|uniref:NADH dehydrogenase [ubiquinone] 1 beta subcomplex subunit 9 n=1 Tax=Botrytis galanthina TaxID=278940 RepID=A0A4S8QU43_9HELO|nr:hypothetical protein BGAL_0232g00020 [Botrytis galanthina]